MAKLKEKLTPRCTCTGAVLYFAVAAAVVVLDQWSKAATVKNIPMYGDVPAIPGIFRLTHVHNTGAAWSMLAGSTDLLAMISAVVSAAIAVYMLYGLLCPGARLCHSAVIGGAVGNLIDRAFRGVVVDMFNVLFMHFAVFNVADIFVVVGGIATAIYYLFLEPKLERREENHDETDPEG